MTQPTHVRTLAEAVQDTQAAQGALTVILGTMSSGKNAVGQAMARAVLLLNGYVAVVQPSERHGFPMRTPADLEARLGMSMQALPNAPRDWRSRVLLLGPSAGGTQPMASGQQEPRWTATLAGGTFWPAEAKPLEWHRRLVLIQDYNALLRAEPGLTPARLRGMALEQGVNIVVLADTTGATIEIGRITAAATEDARKLASVVRAMALDGHISGRGMSLLQQEMPQFAAVLEGGDADERLIAGLSTRPVRVQPGQLQLAEAAHRLLLTVRSSPQEISLHTLKAHRGMADSVPVFTLDAGHLVWPPQKLDGPRPSDREQPRKVAPRDNGVELQEHLHGEVSRG